LGSHRDSGRRHPLVNKQCTTMEVQDIPAEQNAAGVQVDRVVVVSAAVTAIPAVSATHNIAARAESEA